MSPPPDSGSTRVFPANHSRKDARALSASRGLPQKQDLNFQGLARAALGGLHHEYSIAPA
jgi:hypothetical protein